MDDCIINPLTGRAVKKDSCFISYDYIIKMST